MLINALFFLVDSVFTLLLYLFAIRLMLVFGQVSFFHPPVLAIDKLTRPVIKPLKHFLPVVRRIEIASLLVIFLLKALQVGIVSLIAVGTAHAGTMIFFGLTGTLRLILQTFFFAILADALLSWLQPLNPVMPILHQITDPLMRPVRRLIPLVAGIDISPIPVLVGLQFLILLLP